MFYCHFDKMHQHVGRNKILKILSKRSILNNIKNIDTVEVVEGAW